MAGLSKRGTTWYVNWRDANGIVRKKSTGCKDHSAAKKVLKEVERELALDRKDCYAKWRRKPLADHAVDYRDFQLAKGTSVKQADQTHSRIQRTLDDSGIKWMQDLSVSSVTKTIDGMRKKPQSPKRKEESYPTISLRTKNFYAKAIKQLTAWMYREGRIETDLLIHLSMRNIQTDIRHPRRALSDDEFTRLEYAARMSPKAIEGMIGEERAFLYRMARSTGLRKGELGSLHLGSFFLQEPSHLIVEAAYSKHRERDTVYLHPDFISEINGQLASLAPGEPLFPLLSQRKTADMIQADLKVAGIAYKDEHGRFADFHALRHTFVTKAWETNAPANVVMNLARHKDIATTMRYTHKDQSAQIAAIRAMTPPKKVN
ncbi:MAG: tyrosine-type recombinase/integrase [Pirellulaceae bacterium]|nr:tyrosine-type recombinase/integrase [Pirellulaceae bacterium]